MFSNASKLLLGLSFYITLPSAFAVTPNYKEKLAQLEARIDLTFAPRMPELEKAKVVDQIHELVFDESITGYFDKKGSAVKTIEVKDMEAFHLNDNDLDEVTSLVGHKLRWPAPHDVRELVRGKIIDEVLKIGDLRRLERDVKKDFSNLKFEKVNDYDLPTNASATQTLWDFYSYATFNQDIKREMNKLEAIHLTNATNFIPQAGSVYQEFHDWEEPRHRWKESFLYLGHERVFGGTPVITDDAMMKLLEITYLKKIGVSIGPWAKRAHFTAALPELDEVLSDPTILQKLRANHVWNIEIDPEYANKSELFKDHLLILGTTREEMLQVIDLLFGN